MRPSCKPFVEIGSSMRVIPLALSLARQSIRKFPANVCPRRRPSHPGGSFMTATPIRRFILVALMLALPAMARAQEAVLTGIVTDSTGAVLPGVTVRAVHEASGNNFEGVSDARGVYRLPARAGTFRLTAELPGF